MRETVRERLPEFPTSGIPLELRWPQAERLAKLAGDHGTEPGLGQLADGCRPAGEPLVADDAYGSRRLVMAPFSYDGGAPDHWYAWDIDLCWIDVVVGAGVFVSAEDALREWRDAVDPAAAGATLSSCPAGMTSQLLAPRLRTGPLADMLQGNEPATLSASTTGSGAVPATSLNQRTPQQAHPRSMPVMRPTRSWTGTPRGTMTSLGQ
jgi:hypothetical protein